jgi:hypothetical protein
MAYAAVGLQLIINNHVSGQNQQMSGEQSSASAGDLSILYKSH